MDALDIGKTNAEETKNVNKANTSKADIEKADKSDTSRANA